METSSHRTTRFKQKSPSVKESELLWIDEAALNVIVCSIMDEFSIRSVMAKLSAEIRREWKEYADEAKRYYVRCNVNNFRDAVREYIILKASYLLVVRGMIDVNKVTNQPMLNNAVVFEALENELNQQLK